MNKFLALAQLTEDDLNHHAASIAALVWGLNDQHLHPEGDALQRMQVVAHKLYAEEVTANEVEWKRGSTPTVDALILKAFTQTDPTMDAYDELNEEIPARFRAELNRLALTEQPEEKAA